MSAVSVEWKARAEYAVARVVRLDAERAEWKARAEKAEAKLRAIEALCDSHGPDPDGAA